MDFDINTNVSSLQAQNYLQTTSNFQTQTINEVTSGLRIVNSGDDASGLAVANQYRSNEAVLTQGVSNANDGLSQLQIADGGISNISQLLDRARTLATQSATGTFTGDRSVLNDEFQSVLTEINRQAQAIGLNQGGEFAKNLNVFIGGGEASSGVSATTNGTVGINLSNATVDTASLGLNGVQVSGVAGADISSGSANTSLSQILANTTNTATEAQAGYTDFIVKGPGFGGNGVTLQVNTANVGSTSDLVTAINAAIQAAGNGGTQAGTAFANANITASVATTPGGTAQQLQFTSSSTAFQVEAGDRVSNALLGNFAQNAVATSTDANAYVNTTTNDTLTVSIDGASLGALTVTNSAGTSKGQLAADLNADSSFNAVATAYLNGNQLVIESDKTGSASSVAVTGALATSLGFSATASTAAGASTGANLNTQVQGAGVVAAAANFEGSDAGATATVVSGTSDKLYLTVGGDTAQTLTLTGGTNLTKAQIAADINAQITLNGTFTGTNGVTAGVVNNQIVLTANTPGQAVTVAAGATSVNAVLGFTPGSSPTNTVLNDENINLQFQGAGLTSPVEISLNPTVAGTTTTAQVLTDLQQKIGASTALSAAGITLSTSTQGNNLVFTSSSGQQFQVIASGDTGNILGLGSFQAGTAGVVDYTSATAGANYTTGTGGGSGTANLEISLDGNASSTTGAAATKISVHLNGAGTDATAGVTAGTAVLTSGVDTLAGAAGVGSYIGVRVDGGAIQNVVLGNSATETATQILTAFSTDLTGATASYSAAGKLQITSNSNGANSSIEIVNAAGGSDAALLTATGLTAGVNRGANASETNVINQINTAIAASSSLTDAGLQAKDNGSGAIQLLSNNATYFQLNTYGTGNLGFGNSGSTFTGNTPTAAPETNPDFDAQGANASATLAYTNTLYGSDSQALTINATDTSGGTHSIGVTLQNNTTARNQTIDQAVSTINAALQQSNDTTLNQIVAVKEDVGGVQSIRFLSTVAGFQVTVASTPGGTGITPPTGNQTTAATVGTGATANISTVAGATAAVSALATSVASLGVAQAAVGRGENQLTYAVNLASSQLTNEAAAEAQIRDANLATEAANLTKVSIQLQAGIAALAQANSAPQAVLKLLQ
jgi:flagellin